MPMNDEESTMPEADDELARLIGELALNLLTNRSGELSCDIPTEKVIPSQKETPDYIIDGHTIRFSSIESRNRNIADHVFKENQAVFEGNAQMWLSTAHNIWRHEIGKADSAAGRLLALVHEKNDIFQIAVKAIQSGSIQVFDALHVIGAALPFLKGLEPAGIFELCAAQHDKTKNDLAGGIFFNKLEKILAAMPEICRLMHARLRSDITEGTSNLYPTALLALAKTSPEEAVMLAEEDSQSPSATLKRVAIWTLGRLIVSSYVTEDESTKVSAIIIASTSDPIDEVRRTAIHAASQAITITRDFDNVLRTLGESGHQDTLAAIAHTLMLNSAEMKGKDNFTEWVGLLCKLSPLSKGAIDNYDYLLTQLIAEESKQHFVLSCLTEWATINANNTPRDMTIAELFNSTVSELANRRELLSQIITEWFLSDSSQLASSAAGMLSHLSVHGLKNPEFSIPLLDTLKESDLIFLARRLLGYVVSEEHLLSLTLSLLKTKDPQQRTFGIVYSMLTDEIGRDYPDSTIDTLEKAISKKPDSEWIAFYSKTIDNIKGRIKALEDLPHLLELRPPPSLQRQFAMAQAKKMNSMMEESQKKSIIRQLATEIPIKAGHGWFSFRDGSYTGTSHMQSFSHSVSLPRQYILDTVGYELSHFLLRLAKREVA
ncbi:MAG: hypothetical protein C0401_11965 [Anaerolinea sp.]|nr:hypothetical protein [Anaerolinea sp.]